MQKYIFSVMKKSYFCGLKYNMRKLDFLLAFLLSVTALTFCSAQVDTAFWFAVPKLTSEHAHTPITLVVSTFGEPATVTVTKAYSGTQVGNTLNVAANSSSTLTLVSNSSGLSGFECNHNATVNNGLYIHSTAKINAYVAVCQNNSEIYALKGGNGLGTQFFVTTQFQYANGNGSGTGAYSQAKNTVEIIGTENNTTVTITPSKACVGHAANTPFTVTLQRGQVYTLAASSQAAANHLAGTTITSDKPIAVDVSDDSVTPYCTETSDNGNGSADLVADQLVPESMAGGQYIVVPSPSNVSNNAPTASGSGNYYLDYAFVFALENNTDVAIYSGNPNNPTITNYTMNRGDKQKFHFADQNPIFVYATHFDENTGVITEAPVFVFQITGAGKEFGGTQLPHISCTGSTAVGYRPLQSANDHTKQLYLTLLCDSSCTTGFQINGNANIITANDWHSIPYSPFRYCRKNVSSNYSPTYNNMVTFRVTNSIGKFHMGVFDINGSYDDCSISYFSSYTSESSIKFSPEITFNDYCEGDTIIFGFDSVDATVYRIMGPNLDLTQEPFLRTGVLPEHSGWYTVVAHDSRNCKLEAMYDSVEITVHPSVYETVYDTICPGVGYTGYGFTVPPASTEEIGTFYDTLLLQTVEMGCDSFLILDLTIRDIVNRETVYDTVCPGHDYTGFGGLFHFPADSTAVPHILTDSVHLTPVGYGCDSVLTLVLTVRDSVFGEFSHTACNQYTWNGHTYVESGDYQQTLTDAHGCDSLVTMHLEILEPEVDIVTSGEDFCEHGEIVLNAISDYEEYIWNTGDTTSFISVTQPGLYTVTVTQGNCQAFDHYTVPACDFTIILPNAITPSKSDGLNDCLYLPEYVHRFLTEFSIEIYNRWGSLVYWNNDMNFRWCGEMGNRPEDVEAGSHVINGQVYVWIVRVRNLDGKQFIYKGSITVL